MILEIILINDIYIVAFFLCRYYLKWCEGEAGALNQGGGGISLPLGWPWALTTHVRRLLQGIRYFLIVRAHTWEP